MPEIHLNRHVPQVKKRNYKRHTVWLALLVFVLFGWWLIRQDTLMKPADTQTAESSLPTIDDQTNPQSIGARKLKEFSGADFVSFYNSFAYPNVREFELAPSITGNLAADERIRTLAIERGYVGRSVAVPPLIELSKGFQLQERAATAWSELVSAAKKDGQVLTLTAAFRTIEDQRDLFNDALAAVGATPSQIASGGKDNAVKNVLSRISIPGYTRHHSGYTVDIGCGNDPGVVFGSSTCFRWLSKNNYENAKKFGWIPAYPEGAPKQGPDPEAWEYCWVGYDVLTEPA